MLPVDGIEFRRRTITMELDVTYSVVAVDVLINDTRLDRLWSDAHNEGTLPLSADEVLVPGHRLWAGEPPEDDYLVEDGRVAVLTCTCGNFGCGEATALVEFEDGRVRWSDFHGANFGAPVDLGPFEFDRAAYDAALAAAQVPLNG